MPDQTPTQTHGERQGQRRSRSKGQQIVELADVIRQNCGVILADDDMGQKEVNILAAAEIVRLSDKLRELIRIPR